ncbi:uncharacterized protein EAE98_001362 [Botrytis deweyae]|uniref:Uncharacterized protein n=1 Tax=Botrytis deweyae TaxID=2478750 RepID=A0ABQ7J195_9HELO|nr:uncharacterized protein EAE98_001362 [Botrytis deweyae]KAF7939026.1 hypothetical protein EAE98_001362 [Botrytis deweyae]
MTLRIYGKSLLLRSPQMVKYRSTWNPFFFSRNYKQQSRVEVFESDEFIYLGATISVAYINPNNYQSDLTARALFEYKSLCAVVFSNPAAVFLQIFTNAKRNSRQIRDVTGMDLAQIHRAHFYLWVNIALWILVECISGIGMATVLNLLISEITLIDSWMCDICL